MINPRILVTGGSGLLGSYLLRWFKRAGYTQLTATFQNPDSIPSDLREGIEWKSLKLPDTQAAIEIIRDKNWVIHSAALVSYHQADKYRLLEINTVGTADITNACLMHEVDHLIYIGSIGAIGKESNHVTLNESNVWLQNQYSTAYGLSKYLGELEVWRGAAEGLNVSVILPSVILGTGHWNQSSLQLFDRVAKHSPWYPAGQTGYVDVRDVAEFVGKILEKSITGQRWLLNGANVSYKDIYHLIANELSLTRKYRLAPKWLAKTILMMTNLFAGKSPGTDILNHVYGTFSYDATKSLSQDGFHYRPIEKTIRVVTAEYKKGGNSRPLDFE